VESNQLLTVDQLAELLQVPQQTLYGWRTRGEGPPGLKIGRHVRYRRDDVARWLDSLEDSRGPHADDDLRTGRQRRPSTVSGVDGGRCKKETRAEARDSGGGKET
jgi:excisionase family DNA binding protein